MKAIQSVLLVVVLVGVVFGVAFLYQWVSTPTPQPDTTPTQPAGGETVEVAFPETRLQLDQDCEVNKVSRHDFTFENRQPFEVEMGVESKSCRCANVEVLAVPPGQKSRFPKWPPDPGTSTEGMPGHWQAIDVSESTVVIPAQAEGVVRVNFEPRKLGSERISVVLWTQARDNPAGRGYQALEMKAMVVTAAQVYPNQVTVPEMGPGERQTAVTWCWSSTRDEFPLKVRVDPPHPCVTASVQPLDGPARKELEALLNKTGKTQVRSGYKVSVELKERLPGGRELDLGPFKYKLLLDPGEGLQGETEVTGVVRGEVRLQTPDDRDRIVLGSFPSADGTSVEVPLQTTRAGLGLVVDEQVPSYLEARLNKAGPEGHWLLKVTVPPQLAAGPLPPESKVVLKTQDQPPRRIQIPVTGNAYR